MDDQPSLDLAEVDSARPETNREVVIAEDRLQPTTMLCLIERMALNPDLDVAKLQALLDMQERLENRQREAEFNGAFARLQAKLPRIKKNGVIEYPANPDAKTPAGRKGSKTPYALWEDIMAAVSPLLVEEGFALTFDAPPAPDGRISIRATLIHSGGHSRSSTFGPMPLDTSGGKNNLQAAGSSDSYGKRFAVRDLLNLVYEGVDDDGVRGGAEYITIEQAAELDQSLRAAGADRDRYLQFLGVADLQSITTDQFTVARNAISLVAARRREKGAAP